MSCVIRSSARPRARRSPSNRCSTWARTDTSSAETGSSHTIPAGSGASALAIATAGAARPRARADSGSRTARRARARRPRAPRRAQHAVARAMPCMRSGSCTSSLTRMRGLSDWYGSWKTICSFRRSVRVPLRSRRRPRSAARRRSAARGRAACAPASSCRSPTRRRRRAPRSGATRGRRRRARARLRPPRRKVTSRPRASASGVTAAASGVTLIARPPTAVCVSGANRHADSCSSPTGRSPISPLDAGLAREVTARVEAAAGRRIGGIGRRPGMAGGRSRSVPICGNAPSSRCVYGCCGTPNTLAVGPVSTIAPGVHDGHPVAGLGDHAEVVRDQEQRQAQVAAQILEQREHLRLGHHVERRRGLVGDHHDGLAGQRQGDHHALARAARELVRVLVGAGGARRRRARAVRRRARARPRDRRPDRADGWRRRSGARSAAPGSSALSAPWKTSEISVQRRSRMPRSVRRWTCTMPFSVARSIVPESRRSPGPAAAAPRARSSSCRTPTRPPGRAPRRGCSSNETPVTISTSVATGAVADAQVVDAQHGIVAHGSRAFGSATSSIDLPDGEEARARRA